MDTDPQPKGEQDDEARLEQQRRFLLNVGEVVSGFLQPLGIKVDVDVMDEGADKEGEPKSKPGPGEGDLASGASDVPSGSSANTVWLKLPRCEYTLATYVTARDQSSINVLSPLAGIPWATGHSRPSLSARQLFSRHGK